MARGPNILITGTPGTGKTTTASRIAETLGKINIFYFLPFYKSLIKRNERNDTCRVK